MNKITIAGAGSTYTPSIVRTMLDNKEKLHFDSLCLYDIDNERLEDMALIIENLIKTSGSNIKLSYGSDPKSAFQDTDYVFSQIRVGGLKMRELDEKIPLKHGLVGQETCGLGGFSYGLRSMKGFIDLVQKVQTYAPNAWILNYTNPESIIAEAVRRTFPNAKIINACDMTQGIEETIGKNFNLEPKDWITTYYGLNHFGWYQSIFDSKTKKELLPQILKDIQEKGLSLDEDYDSSWKETYKVLAHMTRTFPDFLPNNYLEYYLYPNLKVEKANPNYTRANEVMDSRIIGIQSMVETIKQGGNIEIESTGHGQYIVNIAISLINNLNWRFNLIVPNLGAIPNLRSDAVVEISSYVNARGVEPISLRHNIPDFHKGLMEAQVAAEKLLVDGFFEASYQKVLQAFVLNQTVPNATVAKAVLDEMIIANKDYWPVLK